MPLPDDDTINISAAVVASSPDAIIAADMAGKIISWNPAAERMLDLTADEAIGADLLSLVPADQREVAARLLERARSGEVVSVRTVTRIRPDGSTIVGSLTLAPIRDDDGKVRGSVGIMHDITERRAVRELLQRNQRLASIGTLAAGIAHELNNPVGGILMAAQYAAGALDRDDARGIIEKALADIEADAHRCRDIVRGLLRFAHQESGERSACDLNEIVDAAVGLAQKSLLEYAAKVHFERDDSLPSVVVNRIEIRQAVVNLVTNAMQSGSSLVRLTIVEQDPGATVHIVVSDDGAGVPDDVIDHLFDPFFTTKRQQGSTGLGLSLAHAIVTDHGGSLDVASSSRDGTTVTMKLPLAPRTE